jgi:hypothetical protein
MVPRRATDAFGGEMRTTADASAISGQATVTRWHRMNAREPIGQAISVAVAVPTGSRWIVACARELVEVGARMDSANAIAIAAAPCVLLEVFILVAMVVRRSEVTSDNPPRSTHESR